MPLVADITGVILAGGRSSRFGVNKALAPFRGKTIIRRVVHVLKPIFKEVILITNTPDPYVPLRLPMFPDVVSDKGPMGGIITAFESTVNDRIFVVGCDMPILNPETILKILQNSRDADAAIASHDGVNEYLLALYSRNLLGRMRHCLEEDQLSLHEFCSNLDRIVWVPVGGDSWFNVNTKKDLEFLEKNHVDR